MRCCVDCDKDCKRLPEVAGFVAIRLYRFCVGQGGCGRSLPGGDGMGGCLGLRCAIASRQLPGLDQAGVGSGIVLREVWQASPDVASRVRNEPNNQLRKGSAGKVGRGVVFSGRLENGRLGDKETGRQGDKETGRQGDNLAQSFGLLVSQSLAITGGADAFPGTPRWCCSFVWTG
jgi:hypothetical protein